MLNMKILREILEHHVIFWDRKFGKIIRGNEKSIKDRITIKRKKKMVIEQNVNGIKAKRKNVIKIEIIE